MPCAFCRSPFLPFRSLYCCCVPLTGLTPATVPACLPAAFCATVVLLPYSRLPRTHACLPATFLAPLDFAADVLITQDVGFCQFCLWFCFIVLPVTVGFSPALVAARRVLLLGSAHTCRAGCRSPRTTLRSRSFCLPAISLPFWFLWILNACRHTNCTSPLLLYCCVLPGCWINAAAPEQRRAMGSLILYACCRILGWIYAIVAFRVHYAFRWTCLTVFRHRLPQRNRVLRRTYRLDAGGCLRTVLGSGLRSAVHMRTVSCYRAPPACLCLPYTVSAPPAPQYANIYLGFVVDAGFCHINERRSLLS